MTRAKHVLSQVEGGARGAKFRETRHILSLRS